MTERKTYEAWSFTPLSLSPEEVMSHTLDAELESRIRSIISAEAPIKDTLLKKRLLSSLSLKRCGSRLDEYLSSLISSMNLNTTEEDETVYHREPYGGYSFFRTAPESDRYSYQIPACEAECAIIWVLENEKRMMYRSQLLSAFTKALIYERNGAAISALFDAALRLALSEERIKESGNHKFFL